MKITTLGILAFTCISLTACGVYGNGSTTGYVYAVDDGLYGTSVVWFKTDPKAGESDCYAVDDTQIKEQLKGLMSGQKVRLSYERHMALLVDCKNDDLITKVEEVN